MFYSSWQSNLVTCVFHTSCHTEVLKKYPALSCSMAEPICSSLLKRQCITILKLLLLP